MMPSTASSSSSSSSSSKTQRFRPGHANDEKGPRVATDDEAYDKIAQALLTKIGFDPDNLNKKRNGNLGWTPMIYFSRMGNLQMCRYLSSRGVDCRKTDKFGMFPMYYAALYGHLDLIHWFFYHGGAQDISENKTGAAIPLCVSLLNVGTTMSPSS